jgi:hypothetical protein
LVHTECKLIIIDPERADKLEPIAKKLVAGIGCTGILVLESHEGKDSWEGMKTWKAAFDDYKGDPRQILSVDPGLVPEDDATILFTSGSIYDLLFKNLSLKGSNKSFVRDNGQTQGSPEHPSTISHKFVKRRHSFNPGSERLIDVPAGYGWWSQSCSQKRGQYTSPASGSSERRTPLCAFFPCYWTNKLNCENVPCQWTKGLQMIRFLDAGYPDRHEDRNDEEVEP